MQSYSQSQQPHRSPQNAASSSVDTNGVLLSSLVVVLPLMICVGAIVRKKRREATLSRHVALLEKLWRLTSPETTS